MKHPLIEKYPAGLALVTTFCNDHPELLPLRRARALIDKLYTCPPEVQRIFKKRFGRWHVNVPSLVEYFENPEPIVGKESE